MKRIQLSLVCAASGRAAMGQTPMAIGVLALLGPSSTERRETLCHW